MSGHYILFTWNPNSSRDTAAANRLITYRLYEKTDIDWTVLTFRQGLVVLTADIEPVGDSHPIPKPELPLELSKKNRQPNSDVLVLGELFSKSNIESYQPGDAIHSLDRLSPDVIRKILDSEGRYLVEQCWGHYLAVIYESDKQHCHVLADPTWGVPCFYSEIDGVHLYFSSVTLCTEMPGAEFPINWNQVEQRLLGFLIQTRETGLLNVHKLMPGECRTTGVKGNRREQYWDLVSIAQHPNPKLKDAEYAMKELRRVTIYCVNAWASIYQRILLSLSGGLDSTIVLGCLKYASTPVAVTGLNYYDPGNDERDFARQAAWFGNIELIEQPACLESINQSKVAEIPIAEKLHDYHYGLHFAPFVKNLANQTQSDCLFIGQGGDELFYAAHSPFSAIDYAREQGLFRPGCIRAAMDVALILRVSLGKILKLVYRDRFKRPINPLIAYQSFQGSDVIAQSVRTRHNLADNLHPAINIDTPLAPGKLEHISAMLAPFLEHPTVRPEHHLNKCLPLYSQPLIELCAQIPTYLMSYGGKSRGLIRHAFLKDIPYRIASRESKGCGTSHHNDAYKDAKELLSTMVKNGMLGNMGLIDTEVLESFLTGKTIRLDANSVCLKALISIESWVQKWASLDHTTRESNSP
ncbi:asparagine synthase-related protein [Porticoccus sp. GXU_MW_L64]